MIKRVALSVLTAALALASVAVCPRYSAACTRAPQMTHACCRDRLTAATCNCCGTSRTEERMVSGARADVQQQLCAAAATLAPTAIIAPADPRVRFHPNRIRGPAPPDSPLARHTALLL